MDQSIIVHLFYSKRSCICFVHL